MCVEAKLQTAGERCDRLHEEIAVHAVGAALKAQANQHCDFANLHGGSSGGQNFGSPFRIALVAFSTENVSASKTPIHSISSS